MSKIIVVAGGTGNLGGRIIKSLISKNVIVHAVVRKDTDPEKVAILEKMGAKVFRVNMMDVSEVAVACKGASCVVSALAGLRDVIIDTQKVLVDAAIAAGVKRFIPSDYSLDFTNFSPGENRNLDLRREFHKYLDKTPIAPTTIFNGGFMELLTGQMPMILFNKKKVMYWGSPEHKLAFTTIDDTAKFTASAALDDMTPRFLIIAGDEISPREIKETVTEVTGDPFRLFRAGGLGLLSFLIRIVKTFSPSKNELYPAWQGMQYMRNMKDKRAVLDRLDNNRYAGMHWTTVKELLTQHQKQHS
jgi:uncharacterized protein YbjT (DUF2867 family)